MADVHPIVLIYLWEGQPGFRELARPDALRRFPNHKRSERNATLFDWPEKAAVAVYSESRWTQVIDAYRARGVDVFTEKDLGHAAGTCSEDARPIEADRADGGGARADVPLRRKRGRPRRNVGDGRRASTPEQGQEPEEAVGALT